MGDLNQDYWRANRANKEGKTKSVITQKENGNGCRSLFILSNR